MVRLAWRSLTAHKLRTLLTTLAILLGVAMISGTYVLTDQIDGVRAALKSVTGSDTTLYPMIRGRLVAEFDPGAVTPQLLGAAMTGAKAGAA